MNIESLSSDLAARIPEMSRDSAINNHNTIKGIIQQYQDKDKPAASTNSDDIAYRCALAAIILFFIIAISLIFIVVDYHISQPPPTPTASDNFFIKGWDAAMAAKLGSNRQYVTNIVTVTNYAPTSQWITNRFQK